MREKASIADTPMMSSTVSPSLTYRPPQWLPRVIDELRQESAELLELGLTPTTSGQFVQYVQAAAAPRHASLLRGILQDCDHFTGLVPELLLSLAGEACSSGEWLATMTPKGARMSRTPWDFVTIGGSVLPSRWMRFEPEEKPDSHALRWLLHINAELLRKLHEQQFKRARDIQEAILVRSGNSMYAEFDVQALNQRLDELKIRLVQLRKTQTLIQTAGLPGLRPHDRPPSPYPRASAWQRLKRLAERLRNPYHDLESMLSGLLSGPVAMADVPFLFQRWCGMQIIFGLQRLGWKKSGSMVSALFLGGRVDLSLGPCAITVWIEPRISTATMTLTGWRCSSSTQELTPDFLITYGKSAQSEGYVVDATMSTEEARHIEKNTKYMNEMVGLESLLIAGIPMQRRLRRSWVIAPMKRDTCSLLNREGSSGVIPLHPGKINLEPLDDWLNDLSRQAMMDGLLAAYQAETDGTAGSQ